MLGGAYPIFGPALELFPADRRERAVPPATELIVLPEGEGWRKGSELLAESSLPPALDEESTERRNHGRELDFKLKYARLIIQAGTLSVRKKPSF